MNRTCRTLLAAIIIIINCVGMIVWVNSEISRITTSNNVDIKDRLETIKEKGVLTIATANNRPFAYLDPETNEPAGIDSEIALEIARRLGINKIKLIPIPFDSLLLALNRDNDIDMAASGLYITDERKKVALEPEAVITPKATKFNFKEDLKNAVIGAERGSVSEEIAQNWRRNGLAKNVKTFISDSELILAVTSGEVDAAVLDSLAASYIVSNNKNLNLKVLTPYTPEVEGNVAAAVRKNDIILADTINKELNAMKNDRTLAAIYKKYGVR